MLFSLCSKLEFQVPKENCITKNFNMSSLQQKPLCFTKNFSSVVKQIAGVLVLKVLMVDSFSCRP